MNKLTATALQVYRRRNKALAGLGFDSYDDYLASPLWIEIRERKLTSVGRRCFACGKLATQVHHGDYEEETLVGPESRTLATMGFEGWSLWLAGAELYAVCARDHEWAEHFLGEKLPPASATRRLKNRRKKNGLDEKVPRAARLGRQERRAREMAQELARLLGRDEEEKVMLKLVNLTPHDLVIFVGDPADPSTVAASWPSTGVARAEEEATRYDPLTLLWPGSDGSSSLTVISNPKRYTAVVGLPEPEKGVIYVVSIIVLQALAGSRSDVYAPDTGPDSAARDKAGRIVGVSRLMTLTA